VANSYKIDHLSQRSQRIFEYHIKDNPNPGRAAEVIVILEALDRLEEIRKQLDKEGLFLTSERSKLTRVNPLLKIEERQRQFLLKEWRKRGLHAFPFPHIS